MTAISFGGFQLDMTRRELSHGGSAVPLGSRAFDILCVLVAAKGKTVSKDDLMAKVWAGRIVEDGNVHVHVSALRKALNNNDQKLNCLLTVPGQGYRLIAPVTVVAASGVEPAPRQPDPAPAQLADARERWLVGRSAPLQMLEGLMQQALAGSRQVVFVTGEAGIGKTTLVDMAMQRLGQLGFAALRCGCNELFGTHEAFMPLIEGLQELCRGAEGALLLKALRDRAPTWLAQMPGFLGAEDRAAFQSEVFGATRERMLREFSDLIEGLSVERPWVIVLEDLHWSDFATVDVLSRVARRDRKAAILIMATYRPADVALEGHPVRTVHQDLQIHGRCKEVALDLLTRPEVEHYLALRFGAAKWVHALAERVFARTRGQPLFVVAMVDHLVTQGAIAEIDGSWQPTDGQVISYDDMPHDLRQMISRQAERLTAEERRLLETASAAGAEFSALLVAAALDLGVVDVEQVFEQLVHTGQMLVPAGMAEWPNGLLSGCYAFRHALYQEVLYQRLAPGRRAQTHRRLGESLEQAYGARALEVAPVLASHYELGHDFAKAVHYLALSAKSSAMRFSNIEAASYLTRALGILGRFGAADGLRPRIALLRQRSWALRSCGDLAGSVRDLKEMIACAAQAGELRSEVNGLLAVSQFCLFADRRASLQALEDVLARSQGLEEDTFKALVQGISASFNLYLKGWREQDASLCLKVMELTAGAHDHGTLIRRYGIGGILDCWRSRYQECRRSATEGKRLAREVGDVYFFVLFNVLESNALINLGEWRELRRETTTALALARKNANQPASALCRLTLSWLHVEAMDFDGARALCEGIDEHFLSENHFAYFYQRAVLAKAFVGLRDPQRARKQFDDVQRRMDEDGVPLDFTILTAHYHCLGEYYLQIGEIEQARRSAIQLRDYVAAVPDHNYLAQACGLLARIAFADGDRDETRLQLSQALSIVDNADFPLAAWRVYDGATEIFMKIGDTSEAIKYQSRLATVLRTLAQNFEPDDGLHRSLSNALTTRTARWGLKV